MRRIDTATKAVDLFGPGKHGFKNGDKVGGIAPTQVNAEWFNAVQEELINLAEAIGVVLDPANNAQLASHVVTASNDATATNNSNKLASTGWVRNAMSYIAAAAGFSASLTTNGYIKLPSWLGGLIVQWGVSSIAPGTTGDDLITFPIAFPNTAFVSFSEPLVSAGSAAGQASASAIVSTSQMTVTNTSSASITFLIRWLAVGY